MSDILENKIELKKIECDREKSFTYNIRLIPEDKFLKDYIYTYGVNVREGNNKKFIDFLHEASGVAEVFDARDKEDSILHDRLINTKDISDLYGFQVKSNEKIGFIYNSMEKYLSEDKKLKKYEMNIMFMSIIYLVRYMVDNCIMIDSLEQAVENSTITLPKELNDICEEYKLINRVFIACFKIYGMYCRKEGYISHVIYDIYIKGILREYMPIGSMSGEGRNNRGYISNHGYARLIKKEPLNRIIEKIDNNIYNLYDNDSIKTIKNIIQDNSIGIKLVDKWLFKDHLINKTQFLLSKETTLDKEIYSLLLTLYERYGEIKVDNN